MKFFIRLAGVSTTTRYGNQLVRAHSSKLIDAHSDKPVTLKGNKQIAEKCTTESRNRTKIGSFVTDEVYTELVMASVAGVNSSAEDRYYEGVAELLRDWPTVSRLTFQNAIEQDSDDVAAYIGLVAVAEHTAKYDESQQQLEVAFNKLPQLKTELASAMTEKETRVQETIYRLVTNDPDWLFALIEQCSQKADTTLSTSSQLPITPS